jgi:uncharacterized protein YyaL (SSP411 family)
VARYWDITEEGNFEGRSIAHVTMSIEDAARESGRTPDEVTRILSTARQRLHAARSRRIPPLRDEKVLASWNGLAMSMLAEAGRVLGEDRYVEAATATADFIWADMRSDGRLLHTWFGGQAKQDAVLDDHALLGNGLLDVYGAGGDSRYLDRARELAAALDERFRDARHGGYFFTASDAEPLFARSKPGVDGSLPSGNGAAAVLLMRLASLTGADAYRDRAEEILRLFHEPARRNPLGYVMLLEALERHGGSGTDVVLVGPVGAEMRSLERAVAETYVPHVSLVRPAADGSPPPVAEGRIPVDVVATAYVCRNFTCSPPVTEPTALRQLLAAPPQRP